MAVLSTLVLAVAPVTACQDATPPSLSEIQRAVEQSVDQLLKAQESYVADPPVGRLPDDLLEEWQEDERKRLAQLGGKADAAEWPYEGVHRKGSVIPSGYRVGGTAIVCDVLLRSGVTGVRAERVNDAVDRSLEFVLDMIENDEAMSIGPKVRYDVRGWGHTYALQFLMTLLEVREAEATGDDAGMIDPRIETTIPILIDRLEANQTAMGGWNYANDRAVSPFMTGATLLTLYEAKARGYEVDPKMIERALDALEAGRTPTASYAYSGKTKRDIPMPGSSARSACAELALFKAGRSDVESLRAAVIGFFEGYPDLLDRKSKQGTHEGDYDIAPYYFYFGHAYCALAIEELPERERPSRRAELASLIWSTRDDDGSWNDRIFPRTASYSTAMVVLSLQAADRRAFAAWDASATKK